MLYRELSGLVSRAGLTREETEHLGQMAGVIANSMDPAPSIKAILTAVVAHFKLSEIDIRGTRRDTAVSRARAVAMYLLRQRLHMSYPQIARIFGNRHHTTAIAAVERIGLAVSGEFGDVDVAEIQEKLRSNA